MRDNRVMSPEAEALRLLVRELVDAARARDFARVGQLYTPDAVAISPVLGEVVGRTAIASSWEQSVSALDDASVDVSDTIVEGERVAVLSAVTGVDRFGWFGLPPTGQPLTYRLVLLLTIVGGQIVRDERLYDSAGIVERLQKARLDKELRTAADVQAMLLPRRSVANECAEVTGRSVPCRTIGGDFFEFRPLSDGSLSITIGDVAGKGPAAALLAALIQGMLVSEPSGARPAATLTRINGELTSRQLSPRFATMVHGSLAPDGRFVCTNAGHNRPFVIREGALERLETLAPPVGAFENTTFADGELQLAPGDTVVMFTDGISEASNAAGEEFGEDRIASAIASGASTTAELIERLLDAAAVFSDGTHQADDMTAVAIRVR